MDEEAELRLVEPWRGGAVEEGHAGSIETRIAMWIQVVSVRSASIGSHKLSPVAGFERSVEIRWPDLDVQGHINYLRIAGDLRRGLEGYAASASDSVA